MDRHHSDLDAAIEEVDRLRKFFGRIKTARVRKSEDRSFIKATALSWFRSRRPNLLSAVSADLLQSVDQPYRIMLDACERDSAKSTFTTAVIEAKKALLSARQALLVSSSLIRSADLVPDFLPLASDAIMQTILIRRWNECRHCLEAHAPLAATVMMGGLLEALFVARANKLNDKSVLFKARTTPVDSKTKKALELRHWTLAPYIDVGHELKWISQSGKDVALILRDYRNYAHPEKERAHGIILTTDDAAMLWEIVKNLSRELLAMKGAM